MHLFTALCAQDQINKNLESFSKQHFRDFSYRLLDRELL